MWRAVSGSLLGDDLRHRYRGDLRQPGAKLQLQVAHHGEVRGAPPVNPLHQLPRAKGLRVQARGDERLEFGTRQSEEIYAIVGHVRCSLPDESLRAHTLARTRADLNFTEEIRNLTRRRLRRIRAMDHVLVDAGR